MKPATCSFHPPGAPVDPSDAVARGERFDVATPAVAGRHALSVAVAWAAASRTSRPGRRRASVAPSAFEAEDTAPVWTALRRLDGWRLRHDAMAARRLRRG